MLGGFGPDERLSAWVPAVDERADLGGEVAYVSEGSAVDRLSFDDPEPHLHEVHPRRRGGCEVDCDAGIVGEPVTDFLLLVGGVVVHHQVQLLVRVCPRDVFEEHQKFLVTVPWPADPGDLSGGDLEGCEQCRRAVADVVVGLSFGYPDLHRQCRCGPAPGSATFRPRTTRSRSPVARDRGRRCR